MKICLIICTLLSGLLQAQSTDFCAELDELTGPLISSLNIPADKPYSLSTRSEDDRYLLKLDEFWAQMTECVRKQHNRQFTIKVVDGALGQMAMNFYLQATSAGHSSVELGLESLDSLIIGAELSLKRSPFSLHCRLRVTNMQAQNIYTSGYFDMVRLKDHPGVWLEIFDNLRHARDIDRVAYHRRVIDAVNDNLFTGSSIYASSKNHFQFRRDWNYGNPQQITSIKNILQKVFGFTFSSGAADTIRITADGAVVFVKNRQETVIPQLVDVVEMMDENLEWTTDSFMAETVPAAESDGKIVSPAVYEKIPFEKPDTTLKLPVKPLSIGERIKSAIECDFAGAYSRNMGKPDFVYLQSVFQGDRKNIMRGSMKRDPLSGKERVKYYWDTPDTYITNLREKVEKNDQRYDVKMKVMRLYQDQKISTRYWAVVSQDWVTRDYKGSPVYKDDGFLFINFDFDDKGNMRDLKIFYRLWFYNYKNDDPETQRKRWQIIEDEIKGVFDRQADSKISFARREGSQLIDDASQRGLSGIDRGLVDRMRQDLVDAVKKSSFVNLNQ